MVLEYEPGRGDTEQLLHNKHLYYRVGQTDKWICAHKNCNISLAINTRKTEVVRKPNQHKHDQLTSCELAVKRALKLLKANTLIQIEIQMK